MMTAREWKLAHFQPISFCNVYSLHLLDEEKCQMALDINGTIHWANPADGQNTQLTVSLKEHLDEPERSLTDFDLELVVSDSLWMGPADAGGDLAENYGQQKDCGYIATCWVVYDHLFAVKRKFAVLFKIEPCFSIKKVAKFDLQSVPTFTKLDISLEGRIIDWLVCTYSHGASMFSVTIDDHSGIQQLPNATSVQALIGVTGSIIRYESIIARDKRFLFAGYDTGYVVASTLPSSSINDNSLPTPADERFHFWKILKFDGPISVLTVLNTSLLESDGYITVLISSTIGPATVWTLKIENNGPMSWESGAVLSHSDQWDSVVAGAVCRSESSGTGMVLVGTYGEQLLAYSLPEVLSRMQAEVAPTLVLNIAAPILAISPCKEQLLVLSNRGLHWLSPPRGDSSLINHQ